MVLKRLYLLVISTCLFSVACSHNDEDGKRRPDLIKASSYNVQLGLGYLKQGDRPRAKKKLLTALEQEPKSPDANSALAYYFEQTNEPRLAEKYYLKALSLANKGGAQLNNYGAFLCRQGNYNKAEQYFLKAAGDLHYVNTASAYENAGLCALSVARQDKAKFYFTQALRQDPARKVSFYELVKLEVQKGNNKEAFELVEKHRDLVLNDRMLFSLAKEISEKVGRQDVAVKYKNNKKVDPNLDNGGVNNEYNNHA